GKVDDAGNLKISLVRDPYNIVFGGPHFYWKLELDVLGGGLVELAGSGTYIAPEAGYNSSFVFEMPRSAEKWGSGLRKAFYFKTSDGRFGRIHFDLDVDCQPPPAKAGLEGHVNPNGSRNLE